MTYHFDIPETDIRMLQEVMENCRKQEYTPEKLCQLQKIIDTQYYYWWINDLKLEEYAKHLFCEQYNQYVSTGRSSICTPFAWAKSGKYINSFSITSHMGHNPMVWLIDDSHARGIFSFEGFFSYIDAPEEHVELFIIYCDDFVKDEDGTWKISDYRLMFTRRIGDQRPETFKAPDDYIPGIWNEI